jgi:hypothetical protein
VEEAMIGFKGRVFVKQYLPGKPTKCGMKAWGLADRANGYLLNLDIYNGKRFSATRPTKGKVVLQVTENFWGKWHHINFDQFFCSTNLMNAIGKKRTAVALQGQIEKQANRI